MIDTLFGLIPADSLGQQWLADELQLVNWGGYDGVHRVRFAPTATLLCGGSGSGKSTLMDAYIALMMPHTTPFNGASNGGVTGRARSADQRNIISYGRGKLDETRTEDGTQVRVLRGDGTDTWTAVAMTWRNHDGSKFTAVRAWYIPAAARVLDDVVKVRGVIDGEFSLTELEAAATHRLTDAVVRATGLETLASDREFTARIHSVLGIGAAGAGAKAMSLLARIQAGQQITTVDELYKRMVLEEPETFAAAEAVVNHFDELESARQRMLTAQKQVRALRPIRSIQTRLQEASDQLRILNEVGNFDDPDSVAMLWKHTRRLELLRHTETELARTAQELDGRLRSLQAASDAADAQREGLRDVLRSSGGDRLDNAERELTQARARIAQVQQTREAFDAAVAVLGRSVTSREEFQALDAQARAMLADSGAKDAARDAYAEARAQLQLLQRRLDELQAERSSAQNRRGAIPNDLHRCRELLAQAAGLSSEELPFVGELVEVRTEYEPWREAFNLALGGFATTMVVDETHLAKLRASINDVRIPMRVRFEGVPAGLPVKAGLDDRCLPGRLDYADSPFTGWLQDRLERQFDFVCVDSASGLGRHRKALTITGQVSQGSRGAHGGQGGRNVLGFSNHRRLAELEAEATELRARLAAAAQASAQARDELDGVDAHHDIYRRITELTWEQLDTDGAARELARWETITAELIDGNPKIADLKRQIDELKRTVTRLQQDIGRVQGQQELVAAQWDSVATQVDEAQAGLDAAEDAERSLTAEQDEYLAGRFEVAKLDEQAEASRQLAAFDTALANAAQRIAEERDTAVETCTEQREHLRRTMEAFLEAWPNPTLLADPETSLKDFERILEDLETSGLHELEAEWKASLLKLSGNDLANLESMLQRALREIQERIEPINQIMQNLPFYDDDHRLQIAPRENQPQIRRTFRKDLREVRAQIQEAHTDEERSAAYERMSKLIARIRRGAPDFAELVDVRNHVRISAEKVTAEGRQHVSLYDHIGEKSGGESQELIAFIVGAALRYQLGDADAERPRYAPVFLDEALIKADAHFTKRAIGAWRGLGFQLIIGAPNDKYSAIEPHVDAEYDILKDTQGRSWAKAKVALPD